MLYGKPWKSESMEKKIWALLAVGAAILIVLAWPNSTVLLAPLIVFAMIYIGLWDACCPWLTDYGLGVGLIVMALPIVLGIAGYLYLLKHLDKWKSGG
jgi:uncharacterized membrane protein (DUF441 family)